jgi:2-succinyl-5-enolpyruvyl-6-hydroxy-3-cyclohexene-1-carboxylate synthase
MTLLTETLVVDVLQQLFLIGVKSFCICPGARNAPFISLLKQQPEIQTFYFYDERSASFFALGKCRESQKPAAVITTSGSATAHLLAAAMEAYYTAVPLLLITADRPRHYRGCNPPQTCEQVRLYGKYTPFSIDLEEGESFDLLNWDQRAPAHINICLEERSLKVSQANFELKSFKEEFFAEPLFEDTEEDIRPAFDLFLENVRYPFVVVSQIKATAKEAVAQFLLRLNAPVFLEGTSGLREDHRLSHLLITRRERLWESSNDSHYPIDGILRIGGVPTFRLWRDLEDKQGIVQVFSINEAPFSGLSWGPIACTHLYNFFSEYRTHKRYEVEKATEWLANDRIYQKKLNALFEEEPEAEPSLFHSLSRIIQHNSRVFVGTSLPIRQWDLAASYSQKNLQIFASRGINGIDGQISTFLGLASRDVSNWAILGDLTTLHDMSGPWIIPQLNIDFLQIVVVNNKGGKIFDQMFLDKEIQNEHNLHFKSLAEMWSLTYKNWKSIPPDYVPSKPTLIELEPDPQATQRFWKKLSAL